MPFPVLPPATRDQADAHRYGLRRLEAALVRADPVPQHEQLRAQRRATLVGVVLALLGLGAAAVQAALAPRPDWSRQALVVGTPSGAVYAVAHEPDRLVPVPDAVAGRLVLAALGLPAGAPRMVRDTDLAGAARTPPADLPGATGVVLDGPAVPERWAVCDGPDGATVLAGTLDPQATPAPALFVETPGGERFAVLDGLRHAVGTDPAVLVGLGLAATTPRRIGASTLSAIPEGPALTPPLLPDGPGPRGVPGRPGDVLTTTGLDGGRTSLAVVPGGVQQVPASLAEVLRAQGGTGPREVAPAVVAEAPRRTALATAGWPDRVPAWSSAEGVVCATSIAGRAGVSVTPALPAVPEGVRVPLTGGEAVAAVLRGGGPVRAVSPTGGGTVWLVSASGIAHGVADAGTAAALGLPGPAPAAPEAALRLLPQGGRLDLADARRAVGR
ncbi:type VII secretion protein EccB [Pseudonocardia kujensis]|uniref:type VII secretion protein EccB n=1 Tax=Pseudonocardia kujensis TaxID=1128675 RepID=UPI001E6528C6|nr:type VII secretion protein EccB [Pseudonocardia kujensis]MCE0762514.1 type VII secretion protein EccB [Pseudonocardia kujensis]